MKNGHRLTFLVVEVEPLQALSTRKLLLEGAKHNVLTAHSTAEGLRMFQRFPRVDVVAIDGAFGETACNKLAEQIRNENQKMPIVAFVPHVGARCSWADKTTNSHDPAGLLKLLEKMGGSTEI